MSPSSPLALCHRLSPLQPTVWEWSPAISERNSVALGESAAGGVIVDLAWEWLMRCHFPDAESVVEK